MGFNTKVKTVHIKSKTITIKISSEIELWEVVIVNWLLNIARTVSISDLKVFKIEKLCFCKECWQRE